MISPTVPFFLYSLRYYPNLATGEFVNVGVGMVTPSDGWWDVAIAEEFRPITCLYPGANQAILRSTLVRIRQAVDRQRFRDGLWLTLDEAALNADPRKALDGGVGPMIGSLRWSDEPIRGVTTDRRSELAYWFQEMVQIAESKPTRAVEDTKIESILKAELERRRILNRLLPAEVGSYMKERFSYTHSNGRLNVFEPLRLNYRRAAVIRIRAQFWRGKLDSLNDGVERPFNFFALVDMPKAPHLRREAETGLEVLKNAQANQIETFTSEEIHRFGERVEEIVTAAH